MACCCCGGRKPQQPPAKPGCKENRRCTDLLFLLFYLAFLGGWVFIAYLGYRAGDPYRLLYGTDSLGNLCSRPGAKVPSDALLAVLNNNSNTSAWLGDSWAERKTIWCPLDASMVPSGSVVSQVNTLRKLGICVKACPTPNGDWLHPLTFQSYTNNRTLSVLYKSDAVLHRCIPKTNSNLTAPSVAALVDEWLSGSGVIGSWWEYVQAEIIAGAVVIGICTGAAVGISYLVVFLLRWTVGLITYLVLILFELAFVAGGVALVYKGRELQTNTTPEDHSRDYVIPIYVGAGVLFFIAFIVFFLIIFMWRRIRIAIEVMKLAADVMRSTPTILLSPLLCLLLCLVTIAWAILVGAYVHTAGDLTLQDVTLATPWNNSTETLQVSVLNKYNLRDLMLWYDFLGFLWSMGICNAMAYMMVAFVAVMFYFSEPNNKRAPACALCRGLWWTIRYHLGTVAFGAFIIACIQLVRFIAAYIQRQLEQTRNDAVVWIGRCIQCCLACLERVVSYINHNAYIVTCIESTGFCHSAFTAVDLIISNLAEMVAANYLADAVFFVCKAVVTAADITLAWFLYRNTSLGDDVEVLVVDLVIIGFIAYTIASIVFHLYDTVQDTVLLCYCYDKDKHDGTPDKPYYFNSNIQGIIGRYNLKVTPGNRIAPIVDGCAVSPP